jgi:superfamily II DNA/RNA helicase
MPIFVLKIPLRNLGWSCICDFFHTYRYTTSIDDQGVHPLAIVLAPTRELAAQIHLESRKICFGSQLRSLVLYGGSEIRSQLAELSFGCDIIIATPGRLIDIIDRGIISLSQVLLDF